MGISILNLFIRPNMKETLLRFPLPLLFAFIATGIGLLEAHNVDLFEMETMGRIFAALFSSFLLSVSMKFYAENHNWHNRRYYALSFIVIAAIFLLFSTSAYFIEAALFMIPGLFLSLVYSPYLFTKNAENDCCSFNTSLVMSIFFAGVSAVILSSGLSLALISIKYLFGVNISHKIYSDIWMIGIGLFAPYYALSGIAPSYSFDGQKQHYPAGIKFIVTYILSPLVIGYMVILYAYIAKIVLQGELPKGNLSYMIISFGTVGILTHFFAYPLDHQKHPLLKLLARYFYMALLAPVALLFFAIGIRISEYGITEQRYAVILLAIWLGVSSVYMVIKRQPSLKFIPLTISLLLILAAFGPWSAANVSEQSQYKRLVVILEENNLLENGKIVTATADVPFETRKNISSIVEYFGDERRSHLLIPLFSADSANAITKNHPKHLHSQKVMAEMGLEYVSRWTHEDKKENISIHNNNILNNRVIRIHDFDYMLNVSNIYPRENKVWKKTYSVSGSDKRLSLSLDKGKFTVANNQDQSVVFDLTEKIRELKKAVIPSNTTDEKDLAMLTMEQNISRLSVKIYLKNINARLNEDKSITINNVDLTLFIKDNSGDE